MISSYTIVPPSKPKVYLYSSVSTSPTRWTASGGRSVDVSYPVCTAARQEHLKSGKNER